MGLMCRGIKFQIVTLATLLLSSQPAMLFGQSFLEKLESAVRERLSEANPINEESLPPPASPPIVVPPPVNQAAQPQPNQPQSAQTTDRIYLGLEAEEVTGGGIGVLVTSVTEGSPAWKAGFETGDRITAINGFAIANLNGMVEQLSKTSPGQPTKFLVSRADRNFELVAVVMAANLAEQIAGRRLPTGEPIRDDLDGAAWLGLMVNDLTQSFRNQFGISSFRGAAVTNVTANSPAAKVGVKAGDAVLSMGGIAIESARDLTNWMSNARPGQQVSIVFQRGSITHNAMLTLEVTPDTRSKRSAIRGSGPTPAPRMELTPSSLQPGNDSQAIIDQLRGENERLKAELQKANELIESTQKQLNQIRNALGT